MNAAFDLIRVHSRPTRFDRLKRLPEVFTLHDAFILSAVRTPIGKFGGRLAHMTSPDLGVVAAQAALSRAGIAPEQVEETIFGSARQAGNGPNPARQISVRAGVPRQVTAYTVNMACASGLKSIALAFQQILA